MEWWYSVYSYKKILGCIENTMITSRERVKFVKVMNWLRKIGHVNNIPSTIN